MSSYIINGTCISGTCKTIEMIDNFNEWWVRIGLLMIGIIVGYVISRSKIGADYEM